MSNVGSISALVQRLRDAGATDAMIADVLDTFASRIDTVPEMPARTARQDRNARYYVLKRLKASYSDVSDGISDASPSLKDPLPNLVTVEVNPNLSPPIVPPLPRKNDRKAVTDAFEGTIDKALAEAVVEHRQKLRKPLTPRAAGLLAKQFSKAPNASEAAEMMIARGWAGYEPSWAAGNQRHSTGPPGAGGKVTSASLAREYAERIRAKQNGQSPDEHPQEFPAVDPDAHRRDDGPSLFERGGLDREFTGKTIDAVAGCAERR